MMMVEENQKATSVDFVLLKILTLFLPIILVLVAGFIFFYWANLSAGNKDIAHFLPFILFVVTIIILFYYKIWMGAFCKNTTLELALEEHKPQQMFKDYAETNLSKDVIEYLKVNADNFAFNEQYKSIALNDIYMSLFSSLEEHLHKSQSHDIDNISETIRKHLLDANQLIMLFMPKKELVLSSLYYFSENPSAFVNDEILRIVESNYETDLDIIIAIKNVKSHLTS